jgi:TRAP-type C4-dicarboxylate transport system permease small subunit
MPTPVREVESAELSDVEPEAAAAHGSLESSLVGKVARGLNALAVLLVLGLMVLFAYEVGARYLFGNPTGFANQAGAYMTVFIMALGAGFTLLKGGHVAVDVVTSRLSRRTAGPVTLVNECIGLLVAGALCYFSFGTVLETYERGTVEFASTYRIREYLPQIVMPVGFAVLTLVQGAIAVQAGKAWWKGRGADVPPAGGAGSRP